MEAWKATYSKLYSPKTSDSQLRVLLAYESDHDSQVISHVDYDTEPFRLAIYNALPNISAISCAMPLMMAGDRGKSVMGFSDRVAEVCAYCQDTEHSYNEKNPSVHLRHQFGQVS